MKRIFVVAVCIILCLAITGMTIYAMANREKDTISEVYIPSETSEAPIEEDTEEEIIKLEPIVVERVITTDMDALVQEMNKCIERKAQAEKMSNAARALGYVEGDPVIVLAQTEWKNADADYNYYNEIYTPLKEEADRKAEEARRQAEEAARKAAEEEERRRKQEQQAELEKQKQQETTAQVVVTTPTGDYPIARQIWNYMKGLGWNDAVCAGIMGNLMVETGGSTLGIKPGLYNPTGKYYGICQWNKYAYGQIHGASLEAQLDFLRDTIKYEMNTYSSYGYNGFLNITDAGEAARAFAKGYERCGSGSYSKRANCAYQAYQYFVG